MQITLPFPGLSLSFLHDRSADRTSLPLDVIVYRLLEVTYVHPDGTQTPLASTREGYRVLETSHPPTYYLPPDAIREGIKLEVMKGKQSYCEVSCVSSSLFSIDRDQPSSRRPGRSSIDRSVSLSSFLSLPLSSLLFLTTTHPPLVERHSSLSHPPHPHTYPLFLLLTFYLDLLPHLVLPLPHPLFQAHQRLSLLLRLFWYL
jgi:hypothetical protein